MSGKLTGFKRLLFAVVMVLFVAAFLFAFCEIVIRARQPPLAQPRGRDQISSEITYDPTLGWKAIPGFRGEVAKDGVEIAINADGFRDDDWDRKVQESVQRDLPRILFIGDSLTYGSRIPKTHRVSEQLAAELTRRGRTAIVFNAGVPAYGTGQEFRALEELLPRLKPDVVFVWYSTNDVGDSALPYDFRLPQRVYKPFYDLDGRLVLNRRSPLRFSQRVKGTWLENLQMRYFVDWLFYQWEDRIFDPYIHLWNSPLLPEQFKLSGAQKARLVGSLGDLSVRPELRPWFDINKPRNIALWRQMKERCAAEKVRLLFICDAKVAAETTAELLEVFRENGGEAIDYSPGFDPVRDWGGVWGDGHPNGVLNYAFALAAADALEGSAPTPIDFSQATWASEVPICLDFHRPHNRRVLFGEWGRATGRGRFVGREARCIVRSPENATTRWLSVVSHGDPANPEAAGRLEVLHGDRSIGSEEWTGSAPFRIRAPLDSTTPSILFLRIRGEGDVIVDRIEVTGDEPSSG
jgi:hypothetical protein